MPQEGFVIEEGDLINRRAVILGDPGKFPKMEVAISLGDEFSETEVSEMVEGGGAEYSSKGK